MYLPFFTVSVLSLNNRTAYLPDVDALHQVNVQFCQQDIHYEDQLYENY